jgi:A/G-specific adenine glycosylase
MLQQTRVEAVKGYYARFLEALPTIEDLAACEDDALHKLWEGLGYYSRVRNLKKAAQVVVEQYGGEFPKTYEEILALPGIGEYTAGAICSIAYDLPVPAVDGNVLRVISRLANEDTPIDLPAYKKTVQQRLTAIYPKAAGDFTQALMELGATVCGPNRKPDCENCPCRGLCVSERKGTAENLPVRLPKKGRREEKMTVLILECQGSFALCKRPDTGLLAGLWEFPHLPGHLSAQDALSAVEKLGLRPRQILRQVEKKHIFTHIQWDMLGTYIVVDETGGGFVWLTAEQIEKDAALPTAFRQFWGN